MDGHEESPAVTLAAFLLARYAEHEAAVKAATGWPFQIDGTPFGETYELVADAPDDRADNWLCVAPLFVLADLAAKRRIVSLWERRWIEAEEAADDESRPFAERKAMHGMFASQATGLGTAVRALAEVYADHPDYCEEWRP